MKTQFLEIFTPQWGWNCPPDWYSFSPMFLSPIAPSVLYFLITVRVKSSSRLIFSQLYVPSDWYSLRPMFLQTNIPSALCSLSPTFPQSYIPSALCSFRPTFPQPYIPSALCSSVWFHHTGHNTWTYLAESQQQMDSVFVVVALLLGMPAENGISLIGQACHTTSNNNKKNNDRSYFRNLGIQLALFFAGPENHTLLNPLRTSIKKQRTEEFGQSHSCAL